MGGNFINFAIARSTELGYHGRIGLHALEDAIAMVLAQYPQETGILEVLTVKGVLAPDQVISLDRRMLLGNIATL